MKKIILGLALLFLGGCIDQDKAKITEQRWESELEVLRKSAEFELSKLKEKNIDKAIVNEAYYRGGGINTAEAEAVCSQLQKFYFHFRSTGTNEKLLFGDFGPREKRIIYCSRNNLTTDPVYGSKSASSITKIINNNNELTHTNYSILQAEIWGKNKIKNIDTQVSTMSAIKKTCKEFGFKEGTEKFAECLKDLYLKDNAQNSQPIIIQGDSGSNALADEMKRQRSQQNTEKLLGLSQELLKGKSLGEIYGGGPPKTSGGSGSCTLTNSVQSGTNRICYYRCGVGTQTSNVGASQICPLTM
jgi:hypothetical protein